MAAAANTSAYDHITITGALRHVTCAGTGRFCSMSKQRNTSMLRPLQRRFHEIVIGDPPLAAWTAIPARWRAVSTRLGSLVMAVSLLLTSLASPIVTHADDGDLQSQADARLFAQTGFRVDRDAFWDYFSRRGGVTTFG